MTPLTGTGALPCFPHPPCYWGMARLCPGLGDALGVPRVAGTSQQKDIRGQVRSELHPQGSGALQSLLDALRLLLTAKRLLITVSA